MALATSRVTVRASWDTQQRLPYNRNSPRKTHKPKSLFLSPSPSKTPSINKNSQLQINVDELLNFNAIAPRQGKYLRCPEGLLSTHKGGGSKWELNIVKFSFGCREDVLLEDKKPVNLDEETYLGYDRWLPRPPKSEKPRSSHNAAALAYIGDCIYELYARRHFLSPALNIEQYNDRVKAVVRCEAQDTLLQKLLSDNFLSGEEKDVLRWGKNIGSAKTRTTKRAGVAVYNRASSLETLIGYLYLTNPQRLEDMMSSLGFSINISNQTILEDLNLELEKVKLKKVGDKVPQPT